MTYGTVPAGFKADGKLSTITALFNLQVGFIESGGAHGNDGNITPYGKWYGLDGNPYCGMGVSWAFFHGGLALPASTSKGFAYTPSGAAWFKKNNKWSTKPKVGYVPFYQFGSRIDHVGFCTAVNKDGSIQTIEFNTSSGSSGSQVNGGGCYRRTRKSNIVGYGIPDYTPEGPTMPTPGHAADYEFMAYDPSMVGGVRIASGDVNGDGKDELVTVPGPGYPAHVKVLDAADPTKVLASFYAYDTSVTCGFFVSCEDIDGDGVVEIVVAPDHGGGPHVKAFKFANVKS